MSPLRIVAPKFVWLMLIAGLLVLGFGIYIAMSGGIDTEPQPAPVNINERLRRLERRSREDRYLLCHIADAVAVDAAPQPCLETVRPS